MGKVNWDDTEMLINSVRDRERRRIRRAQADAVRRLRRYVTPGEFMDGMIDIIDAATRKGAGRTKR